MPGLFHASGHEGAGIGLAPATAELITALVAGTAPPVDPAPFAPARFALEASAGARCSVGVRRMSVLRADVAVVGAGPAGMAAALAAADLGAQVVLVDAGAAMGGQIYRQPATAGAAAGPSVGPKLPPATAPGRGHPRIRHLPGTTVWQAIK